MDSPPLLRGSLQASWKATARAAEAEPKRALVWGLSVNAASMAGLYLDAARGNQTRAIEMLPSDRGEYWLAVRETILSVGREERDYLVERGNVVGIR